MDLSFSSKRKINLNISALLIPLFFLLSLIVLFVFSAKTASSKISQQLKTIKEVREKNVAMENKIEGLRSFEGSELPESELILSAFPQEDPSLFMLTQIKRSAEVSSLVITGQKISFTKNDTDAVSKSNISFIVLGDSANIIKFLLSFDGLAPISSFDKILFSQDRGGSAAALVDMAVYFAKIPSVLPQIDAPVTKLTQEEQNVILKLSNMEPLEIGELIPNPPFEVTNPF